MMTMKDIIADLTCHSDLCHSREGGNPFEMDPRLRGDDSSCRNQDKINIIFIESNTTGTGELLIYKALEKGLSPLFITRDPNKYSFLPLTNLEVIVLDTHNNELILDYLSKFKNIKGIYSSSEMYIETAAWLASKLGLLGTEFESVKLCRNKFTLYQTLMDTQICQPVTYCVNDMSQAAFILNDSSFPLIIKPNRGTGSTGVKLCSDFKECCEQITLLFNNGHSEVLIQDYSTRRNSRF